MFSQAHRTRVRLLIQLLFLANASSLKIKDLIEQTSREKDISTIAFFGNTYELEAVLGEVDANIPRMVYTESYGELYFGGSFNKDILVVACINLWQRSMLNRIDVAFREIHPASRSIYLVRDNRYKNLQYLGGHFEWCWTRGFVNVVVHFAVTGETFSYTRFPEMRIYRRAPNETGLFPSQFSNLRGYTIRTPLQHDPPRVFEYTDSWGRKRLTGYCADIFLAFLRAHNATMAVVRVNNSTAYNIPGIVNLIRAGLVDISIHPFVNFNGVRSSYPIRMMQWCILVPFRGEIKGYWYFIRPFQPNVWLCCVGVLVGVSFYVSMDEFIRGQSYDFGRSCCDVYRLILNLPTTDSRPVALNRALRTALVFMVGFMLCNLYLAYLTSFLAKVIFEPQIKTLQELVTNNISILTTDFEIPIILQNRGLPAGFKRLLIPSPRVDVLLPPQTALYNQSFAYTTSDDKAAFFLTQQVHLMQPIYKTVDESVSTIPLGFLMPRHSPFEGILNRYIQRINAAGLVYKWQSDMYTSGLRAGLLKVLRSSDPQTKALNVEHFQFAWIALAGGLGLAAVCAALERVVAFACRFKIVVAFR